MQYLIDILPQSLQLFMQYLTILHRIITALDYITSITAVPVKEHNLDFELTQDTPYLVLTDALWEVFYEEFGETLTVL